jgi:polar amino acid transport system substrate-binding protein
MESEQGGIEVEIAEQALAAVGCKMKAMYFPPARGLGMLKTSQIDGLMTTDEGIGGDYYFSDSYIVYQNVATTLTNRHINLQSIDDLSNYSVAGFQNASVILGSRFNALVARHKDYKEYPYQLIQDNLLYSGRVDMVVGDRLIFRYFSAHMMPSIDSTQPVTFHSIFPPNPRKVAFRNVELRDRFNAGLKIIRSNGTYDTILKKYQQLMLP